MTELLLSIPIFLFFGVAIFCIHRHNKRVDARYVAAFKAISKRSIESTTPCPNLGTFHGCEVRDSKSE